MTSIKDIARLAGVSPSTVSRVLNEREYVREEVRQRVLDIVKEQGYVQNHVARSRTFCSVTRIEIELFRLFSTSNTSATIEGCRPSEGSSRIRSRGLA